MLVIGVNAPKWLDDYACRDYTQLKILKNITSDLAFRVVVTGVSGQDVLSFSFMLLTDSSSYRKTMSE